MICVYPADCTDFSTNGNGTIEPTSALVTETLNGEYELQLVHIYAHLFETVQQHTTDVMTSAITKARGTKRAAK